MPPWADFEPFIVSGLALGGVYALSGVGLVVLYRATGVLYLAFGAAGALGALTAWSLGQHGAPGWAGDLACIAVAAAVTLGYGTLFGPALAKRDPLVKAVATIGLTLVLYGLMDLLWTTSGGQARSLDLPTDKSGFVIGQVTVTDTQVIVLSGAWLHADRPTGVYARYPRTIELGPVDTKLAPTFQLGNLRLEIDEEYVAVVRAADAELAGAACLPPDPLPDL